MTEETKTNQLPEIANVATPRRAPAFQLLAEAMSILILFTFFNWSRIIKPIFGTYYYRFTGGAFSDWPTAWSFHVTDWLTIVILLFFIALFYTAVKPSWFEILRPWRPSGYITLGLLGTFFGVAFSLQQVDFTKRLTDLELENVLKAVSLAFDKSVIGVLASIIASIGNRFTSERQEDTLEKQALLSTVNNLSQLPALVERLNIFFKDIGKNFSTSLTDALARLVEQNRVLIDAEKSQRQTFFTDLLREMGSVHHKLIKALEKQAAVLEAESGHLEQLFLGLDKSTGNLARICEMLGNLEKAADRLNDSSKNIENAGLAIGRNAETVQSNTVSYLGTILSRIKTAQEQSASIGEIVTRNSDQLEKMLHDAARVSASAETLIQRYESITAKMESSLSSLDGLDTRLEGTISGFLNTLNEQLNENIGLNFNDIVSESIERIKEVGKQQDRLSTEIYDSGAFILASVSAMESQFSTALGTLSSSINKFDGSLTGKMGQLEKAANHMVAVQRRMDEVTAGWKDHRSDLVKAIDKFSESTSSMVSIAEQTKRFTEILAHNYEKIESAIRVLEEKSKTEVLGPDVVVNDGGARLGELGGPQNGPNENDSLSQSLSINTPMIGSGEPGLINDNQEKGNPE